MKSRLKLNTEMVLRKQIFKNIKIYKFKHKHIEKNILIYFNPIQDGGGGGGKKAPPTSFSPLTSTDVGISPQNFLTFIFDPFPALA